LLLIQTLNFVLLAFGGYWFYPRLLGTFFNWILSVCHLCVIGATYYVRFNPWGRWCSYNEASNNGWAIEKYDELGSSYGEYTMEPGAFIRNYRGDALLLEVLAAI